MIKLSDGELTRVVREFDVTTKAFIPEEHPFVVPEGKNNFAGDRDTAWVGHDSRGHHESLRLPAHRP